MSVELSGEAPAQVREIEVAKLEATPTLGTRYDAGKRTVRRLLLPRTHYHLSFVVEPDRLYVVAVWSAFRGRGPTL